MNDLIQEEPKMVDLHRPDLLEGLQNKRARLVSQLATVDAAIAALTENPTVYKVLELVGKAGRI